MTPAGRAIHVAVTAGLLTVETRNGSLKELLQEIILQTGLVVVGLADFLDAEVTMVFAGLPLEEGLRRILPHHNLALMYTQLAPGGDETTSARLSGLWIFPKDDEGRRLTQTSDGRDVSDPGSRRPAMLSQSTEIRAALSSDRARTRRRAIEGLGMGVDGAALPLLRAALGDEDERVREAAVGALASIGGEAAVESLDVALQDENFWVRREAVRALGKIGSERAASLLVRALSDEDEFIRDEAADALTGAE